MKTDDLYTITCKTQQDNHETLHALQIEPGLQLDQSHSVTTMLQPAVDVYRLHMLQMLQTSLLSVVCRAKT